MDHKVRGVRIGRVVAMMRRFAEAAGMGRRVNCRLDDGNYAPEHGK